MAHINEKSQENTLFLKEIIMTALRMMFLTAATVISLGIYLSGWDQVHWLLYIPPAGFLISAITGFCPPVFLYKKLGFK